MGTLILIGLLGGLISGISPCILPVLTVIFFSGTQSARTDSIDSTGSATSLKTRPKPASGARPYLVIAGLVVSFSAVTLVGSALLSVLGLPRDAIRWVALAALILIGIGLIFPRVEEVLQKPFSRLPHSNCSSAEAVSGAAWRWAFFTCRARDRCWRPSSSPEPLDPSAFHSSH